MHRFAALGLLALCAPACVLAQTALQMPPRTAAAAPALPSPAQPTLDHIRSAKAVNCGVVKEEEDYSRATDHGNRAALDIDLCKAVTVATLGPGARVVIRSFPDEPFAMRALRSGEVDLIATASLTVGNMARNVLFSPPVLMDGQGFLLLNRPAVHSPLDLAGKRVCFLTGSAAEDGLHRYASAHGISYVWYPFSEAGEMEAAFFTANCDAITSDLTQLGNIRAIDSRRAHEFTILPQTIRPDPLAIATWAGDPHFAAIVYWTVEALLGAEAQGITQSNVGSRSSAGEYETQQFLGQRFGTGTALGLNPGWVMDVIGAVGNYGEIYERDLGDKSKLRLPRGENQLAAPGGRLVDLPLHPH